MMQKTWKITETLANGYSSESTKPELFNEYQHDNPHHALVVKVVSKPAHWIKKLWNEVFKWYHCQSQPHRLT